MDEKIENFLADLDSVMPDKAKIIRSLRQKMLKLKPDNNFVAETLRTTKNNRWVVLFAMFSLCCIRGRSRCFATLQQKRYYQA